MKTTAPNPRRVAAGRVNGPKRGPLTAEGRQQLQEAALRNQPWRFSTGPKTAAGKAQVVKNGKKRQIGPRSVREIRAELAGALSLLRGMGQDRQVAEELAVNYEGDQG